MPRAFHLGAVMGDVAGTMTAAGTTSATAATVTADHVMVSTSTATENGVILRAMDAGAEAWIGNADTVEPVFVYPPSGAAFNGETADLPAMIPSGKAAIFKFITSTKIIAMVSA